MTSDIFISYASEDVELARLICKHLESHEFRCWLACRDIASGDEWSRAVVEAIGECKCLLLVFTAAANASDHVADEVALAVKRRRKILAYVMEEVKLTDFFELHLSRRHRLHADRGTMEQNLARLTGDIRKMLSRQTKTRATNRPTPPETDANESKGPVNGTGADGDGEFENPYEFDTTATAETFKGRAAELDELMDSIESGTHTAIFGLQRMGKSSLIEQALHTRLPQHPALAGKVMVSRIDFQNLGGDQVRYKDFASLIIESLVERLHRDQPGVATRELRQLTHEFFSDNTTSRGDRSLFFSVFARLLSLIAESSRRRLVLVIDEFSEVRKVIERNAKDAQAPRRTQNLSAQDMFLDVQFMHHLSSLLKDRELKRRLTLIVCVRPFMADYDSTRDLQLLKLMKPIALHHLDEPAARALMIDPLAGKIRYEPGATDHLYHETRGHPYLIQFILKLAVDRLRRPRRDVITTEDLRAVEERMVNEKLSYDAQFNVLTSDYSVAEIAHPREAELGKGLLALLARLGADENESWVSRRDLMKQWQQFGKPAEKLVSLLSQLARTRIIEESARDDEMHYRVTIPLLRKRLSESAFPEKLSDAHAPA